MLTVHLKSHDFLLVCFTTLNSKLYILTKLNGNGVNFTPIDGQTLDLSKYVY